MNQNNQNYCNPLIEDEEPIDWAKYLTAFFQNWRKIAVVTIVFAVLGVIIALCQERKYSVSVTLAPESSNSSGGGSLGGLASMLGVNMSSGARGADALNVSIFPEIASSTPFVTSLFTVELNKMPKLPKDNPAEARRIMNGPLKSVVLFDYLSGRDKTDDSGSGFWSSLFGRNDKKVEEDAGYLVVDNSKLTKEQFEILTKLQKMISVSVDKKTGITIVSVEMNDPLMCAQLADTVCQRLQDFIYTYRTEKERQTFEYYEAMCDSTYKTMVETQAAYASSVDNNQNVILQKVSIRSQRLEQEAAVASQVYQQMVQQRELSRAHLQEVKPVFAVVEPSSLPQLPVNSRKNTCISVTLAGFLLACLWFVIGKEYCGLIMSEIKNTLKR